MQNLVPFDHPLLISYGLQGRYAATESGDIYSYNTNTFLKGSVGKDGYVKVTLRNGKVPRTMRRGRVIAMCFEPSQCLIGMTVNHLNGVKTDDRPINLEWATTQQNTQHAYDTGLASRKLSDLQVRQIFKLNLEGWSGNKIADFFEVHNSTVSLILSRQRRGACKI
tara:strand:+ start:16945 stop:17442 length:498 start_codon:yes stop_codon:yes gene_type:complete